MNAALIDVTARIRERSARLRAAYLARLTAMAERARRSDRM